MTIFDIFGIIIIYCDTALLNYESSVIFLTLTKLCFIFKFSTLFYDATLLHFMQLVWLNYFIFDKHIIFNHITIFDILSRPCHYIWRNNFIYVAPDQSSFFRGSISLKSNLARKSFHYFVKILDKYSLISSVNMTLIRRIS